ncbi:MAG: carbon-nitrogen hydrolase family protein [Thermoleophilia bacterium]|nr:carbon-nitrogen hydrolase family protein [Thermoleophilia bacterium]
MGDQPPRMRVAAVHAASVFLDREASVSKACNLIADAARGGARLIAFPETFVPGYPYWIWTHTPPAGAPLFRELYLNSVEVPSPATEALGAASREAGAYVVMGVSERDGGTLYNTLLYFDDQGALLGRHRKLQPTQAERMIWDRGDSSDMFVLPTRYGRLGGLICFEHTMDLARYSLTAMGEQIHVAAWPAISAVAHDPVSRIFDSISEAAAKHHALAGQTFVINVQPRVDEETVDRLGFEGRPEMLRVGGGWSAIVGPNGQIIAGPVKDEESILYADIDLADIVIMKQPCDSAGHYARPDVFSFGLLPPAVSYVQADRAASEGVSPDRESPALDPVDSR